MYTTLVSPRQLSELLSSHRPCMVFDCSFELMDPTAGERQYVDSHIPGAVRADLNRHLSASANATDAASGGRHPLPSRESFASWLGGLGFDNNMQAVVYDRQCVNYCGRLWWMLKWVGHENVAVLDGGLQAWQAQGGHLEAGVGQSRPAAQFRLASPKAKLKSTDVVARDLGRAAQNLIDARSAPRFRGEVEPLDPVAGHIPGALNRPFGQNFDANGNFKPASQLREEFAALLGQRASNSVVHHCGSGVSALPNLIGMEIAGLAGSALYAGSWSEWCSDDRRPVARG